MLKYPISGRGDGESIRDTERDNLYLGWDNADGFVFLFTPDMNNTDNHYHVELSDDQATRNHMGTRSYDIGFILPEEIEVVHEIKTDDAAGIEEY